MVTALEFLLSSRSCLVLSCLVSDEGHPERSVREQGAHRERLHSMRYHASNYNDGIVDAPAHLTACVTSDGTGTNFRGAILKGSRFYRANLKGADFSSADLSAASLEDTLLLDANFNDAVLEASYGLLDIYPLNRSFTFCIYTHIHSIGSLLLRLYQRCQVYSWSRLHRLSDDRQDQATAVPAD